MANSDASATLAEFIERFDRIIDESDSEHLKLFKEKVDALDIPERVGMSSVVNTKGGFLAFTRKGEFAGEVLYDPALLEDFEQWAYLRFHEMIHAIQYFEHPIMHAQPSNQKASVWVSPADYIFMILSSELEAYTKQAWLESAFMEAQGLTPKPQSLSGSFNQVAAQDDFDLRKTLAYLAVHLGFRQMFPSFIEGEGQVPFSFNYQRYALSQYITGGNYSAELQGHDADAAQPIVKLSDEEIMRLTENLGQACLTNGKGELCEVFGAHNIAESLRDTVRDLGLDLNLSLIHI